jgi:hypothetical protein
MTEKLAPQRRFEILDQHNERVRELHAPGLSEADAIADARRLLDARPSRAPTRVPLSVRVVEYGCDPKTGASGPNFNLGPAPGGGYIVSRLVYDSDEDPQNGPFYKFLAAVRKAVEDYDLTKDHDWNHNYVQAHDCVRCHIVACLPPGERPARDRKRNA